MPIFMPSEIYITDTKSILLNSNLSRDDADFITLPYKGISWILL